MDNVEVTYEPSIVPQRLDDRVAPSLCYVTDVWIPGWQFFPCEGVCQSEQMFEVTFVVTVKKMTLIITTVS
jgi:hypothetical protein